MFSCVIAPSSVTLIIPPEQGAKTWAQQENINGLCDIMVPAHSKEMFYYIMGHQQVISHHSLGFIEVFPYFISAYATQLKCLSVLFNTDIKHTVDLCL